MAAASNIQVQNFSDGRLRPCCESIRALTLEISDIISCIGDTYANLTAQSGSTWVDNRTNVPHLATPADLLAINEYLNTVLAAMKNEANFGVVLNCCVTPVTG